VRRGGSKVVALLEQVDGEIGQDHGRSFRDLTVLGGVA
jgi:hypothetical protein